MVTDITGTFFHPILFLETYQFPKVTIESLFK